MPQFLVLESSATVEGWKHQSPKKERKKESGNLKAKAHRKKKPGKKGQSPQNYGPIIHPSA